VTIVGGAVGGGADAVVSLPPRSAMAAPAAATPPTMAAIAISFDELREPPGSTFVCVIEAVVLRLPLEALIRIW